MDVLVTGAGGTVGTALRHELAGHDLAYTDVEDHPHVGIHVADMADYDALRPAFEGRDAVIHLALDPALNAGVTDVAWTPELETNLAGTVTVARAAIDAGVETVVFASTIHTVGAYERELAPAIWEPDHDLRVDHTDARPDSLYAVAKLFGEALGRFAAWEHGLRWYCLRFGAILPRGDDHPYAPAEWGVEAGEIERGSDAYERRVAQTKAHWFSHRDLANLVDRCLRDTSVDFDVFFGVSDNARRWVDIEHAREVVGYDPQDDGDAWTGPPEA